jgi:hypothetical protein
MSIHRPLLIIIKIDIRLVGLVGLTRTGLTACKSAFGKSVGSGKYMSIQQYNNTTIQ